MYFKKKSYTMYLKKKKKLRHVTITYEYNMARQVPLQICNFSSLQPFPTKIKKSIIV
ncbi:hypothetical protein Sjap_007787 [Stephania japonica]|uniref:Uncharacterized protein n=1 Tax=Stephania japonica TaxID=461633 RepID=A0AAP0JPW7_9MAGN